MWRPKPWPGGCQAVDTARATEQRRDPGLQLAQREGLGEVVVGADLEADQPVDLGGARADDHDVAVADHPDLAADLDPVEVGQGEVEGHQVGEGVADDGERLGTRAHDLHLEAHLLEQAADHLSDVGVVLDDHCRAFMPHALSNPQLPQP